MTLVLAVEDGYRGTLLVRGVMWLTLIAATVETRVHRGWEDLWGTRTVHGFWGFSRHLIGHKDNLFAELMTLFKGLWLACNKGCRNLVCFSKSLMAIKLVRDPLNNLRCYAVLIQSIKNLLAQQWNVTLEHTLSKAWQQHGEHLDSFWATSWRHVGHSWLGC